MATLEHTVTLGQSLAVGSQGTPSLSTISETTNTFLVDPVDGNIGTTLKSATTQLPQISMGYRMGQARPAQKFGFSTHGQSGQSINQLSKNGTSGRYEDSITAITAAKNSRAAAAETYNVEALHWIQGEADQTFGTTQNAYLASLNTLLANYRNDIPAISGQASTIPFIMSQTATWPYYQNPASIGLAQLTAARTLVGVYLVGGQYQLPYADGLHLTNVGYYRLGELHARAHAAIVAGSGWAPFAPTLVTRAASTIVIDFYVPVAPLVIDTTVVAAQPNFGFNLLNTAATINNVVLSGPSQVTLGLSQPVTEPGSRVGYGISTGTGPGLGNLRDSEPAASVKDGAPIANWALHFSDDLGIPLAIQRASQVVGSYQLAAGGWLYGITPNA